MSSGPPRATLASTAPSTGDFVSKLSPEIDGTDLAVDHVADAFRLQFRQQGGDAVAVGLEQV